MGRFSQGSERWKPLPADLTWPMAVNRNGSVAKREVVAGETAATVATAVTAVTSVTASNEATASTVMLMANTTAVDAEHSGCMSEL